MKSLNALTILTFVAITTTSAMAFDLPTTAAVEVVEGITITQTTGMDFGQVADFNGNLSMDPNPNVAMTDPNHISFDPTGYTPAIFLVTSIIGTTLSATINDTDATDGLTLSNFTISLNAGISEEADLADITQVAGTDTWHIACDLNVNATTATVGAHAVAYNLNVVLN